MSFAPQTVGLLLMIGRELVAPIDQRRISLPLAFRQLLLDAFEVAFDPLSTPEHSIEFGDSFLGAPLARQVLTQHAALTILDPKFGAFATQFLQVLLQLRPQQLMRLLTLRFPAHGGGMGTP